MTAPRFRKEQAAEGELSRWTVISAAGVSPGVVVAKRWGQASVYWLAYPGGQPARVIRYSAGHRNGRPRPFLSRREAGDALLLQHRPDHDPIAALPPPSPGRPWHPSRGRTP